MSDIPLSLDLEAQRQIGQAVALESFAEKLLQKSKRLFW